MSIKTDAQGHVLLSTDDITRISAAATADDRTNRELIKALTAVIGKAGCPGSSVEKYGLVPALEAVMNELRRAREQRDQLQEGVAYRELNNAYMALRSRSQELGAALELATNMLEYRSAERAQIEEWRKLVKVSPS